MRPSPAAPVPSSAQELDRGHQLLRRAHLPLRDSLPHRARQLHLLWDAGQGRELEGEAGGREEEKNDYVTCTVCTSVQSSLYSCLL
jgi:hypothetical protein